MSWTPLPEDYTDRSWTGLQKYQMITNQDNTVSFNDVTEYTNLADSFFGALQANQITTAINILMAMVEDGTDIYEEFHQYFETQKVLFEEEEDEILEDLEADFMEWYDRMKDQLSEDAAGHLQLEIDNKRRVTTKVLAAANWSNNTYDLTTDFPDANYDIEIAPYSTMTDSQRDEFNNAVMIGNSSTNVITATGTVPSIDIPVMVIYFTKNGSN